MILKRLAYSVLVVGLMLTPATSIGAQATEHTMILSAGPASFDASGIGDTYTLAARIRRSQRAWLGGELGVSYLPLDEQFSTSTTHLLTVDGQVQLQTAVGPLQPYLGVGPSIVTYITQQGGRGLVDLGVSTAVGLQTTLTRALRGLVDARYRGWYVPAFPSKPVNGSVELTFGFSWRF